MHPRLLDAVNRNRMMLRLIDEQAPDEHTARAFRASQLHSDPLRWALYYVPHHLRLDDGTISLSDIHVEWIDAARRWDDPTSSARDIYIAPRGTGKSTWHFTILPLWAAASGRIRFAAAFADSATQAETHLQTFRTELERNALLRADYPSFTAPARRSSGATTADNRSMLQTASGFAFAAKGIDSGTLGLKVGDQRPDLLILDDVEPGESNYSAYQIEKRLTTLTDVVLPMGSPSARTVLVGTTTMTGSIIHQAVLHEVAPAPWINEERFTVHHALPTNAEGTSVWPERWPTPWLLEQQGSRSYSKNFLNQPATLDGEYWQPEDFVYGPLPHASRRIIVVDPAVTTNRTSDETGVAVISFSAHLRIACVDEIRGFRLKGEPLRTAILSLITRYPDIAYVIWERNQGGDALPTSVLHDFPVPVRTVHSNEKKEIRIERALSFYRRKVVRHARSFPALEAQQCEFPHGLHDDLVDAVSLGLDHFAAATPTTKLHQAVR